MVEALSNERKTRGVYSVLSQKYYDLNNKQLKKPQLEKELALVLVNEIINNKQRQLNDLETSLHNVVQKLMRS